MHAALPSPSQIEWVVIGVMVQQYAKFAPGGPGPACEASRVNARVHLGRDFRFDPA